jgi:hypothetical protein
MSERAAERGTLVLGRRWKEAGSELAFVTRALAGAASRAGPVTVIVPAASGDAEPDGAFDLFGAGIGPGGQWPHPGDAAWPAPPSNHAMVVVDEADDSALALLQHFAPGQVIRTVAPCEPGGPAPAPSALPFAPARLGVGGEAMGVHVPVNPLAAIHRHNGLGFTGYLLVLSDRIGAPAHRPPTAMVAWLTARFPRDDIVVVEDATAAVWRGRSLRGAVAVDTRTDLWRLLAHARVTIDLAPGPIIARECIESLRFGTPVVVPAESAARQHAETGGGLSFSGFAELLDCVQRISDDEARDELSVRGRRYADDRYGDPAAFVAQVASTLQANARLQ